jgi:hypothetical protein
VDRAVGCDEPPEAGAGVVRQHRAQTPAGRGFGAAGASGFPQLAGREVVASVRRQGPLAGAPRELSGLLVVIGAVMPHTVIQPDESSPSSATVREEFPSLEERYLLDAERA